MVVVVLRVQDAPSRTRADTKIENTVRDLRVDVEDALALAEATEV